MASPIGILNSQQQSSVNTPTNKQTICGTVIAIDYGVDRFSVGYINPATNEHELFPDNEGETWIASLVRITDHPDGTQDVLVGKDAVLRPLGAHENAVGGSIRLQQEQYFTQIRTTNYSNPVPKHIYDFQPDVAYGLGLPEAMPIVFLGQHLGRWLNSAVPRSTCVDGKYKLVGDEWKGIAGMPSIGPYAYNSNAGECELHAKSDAERDWKDQVARNGYERRQKIQSFLMGRAKELAETRLLKGNVKFAVVVIPSLSTNPSKSPQPESTIDAAARAGLETVRVLDNSEAAVLAYESVISREEAIAGRPQRIVVYYLNNLTEGITVFEASRAQSSEDKDEGGFLGLKEVAKYHFYQSVKTRMLYAMAKKIFEKYTAGEYHTNENSSNATGVHAEQLPHPDASEWAMNMIYIAVRWAEMWSPETGDVQEQYWVSAHNYVLFSHQEWWDFEKEFLKTHYRNMLERAYEKSGVKEEERRVKLDLFLVVDQSQFKNISSGAMMEALGGGVRELYDPAIAPEHADSYGAARLAEYLTKRSSHSSCT
ncbi:hypothetical protein KI688_004676 [Linnemannia hyalina]|uniref:Actin-like ATPase domain-containing protein n=1 Tax=Linnemannia hyalina TaxID=64524 RepID=A0A9P7XP18_9FUNG|nr:hypothetical protein KI688_004676 [Linnemannia hyalina]